MVPGTSDQSVVRLVALCKCTFGLAVQFIVNVVAVLDATEMLPRFAMVTVPVTWKLSRLKFPAPVNTDTSAAHR